MLEVRRVRYRHAFRVTSSEPRSVPPDGNAPIAEMQFADFISCAFDQITNFAAKCRYRWGAGVLIVGAGRVAAGCTAVLSTQNPEMYFVHTWPEGVCLSTAYDAKGLIKSAIRDPFTSNTGGKSRLPKPPSFLSARRFGARATTFGDHLRTMVNTARRGEGTRGRHRSRGPRPAVPAAVRS